MKPSRLAAMWIVTRDFVFSIVTPRCRAQWMFVPQSLAAPDQPAWLLVILRAVKGLACGLLVSLVCWAPLVAQERDRSLERIGLALQQPIPVVRGEGESTLPKTLGVFTLVQPTRPGEIVRISIPIGEFVSRAFRSVAVANQRRQEAAARRKVDAALQWFEQ